MSPDPVRTFFDEKAPVRSGEFQQSPLLAFEQARRRAVIRALAPRRRSSRVLDLGCGNLLDHDLVREQAGVYVGADFSHDMLLDGVARCPEAKGVVVLADARALPFRTGTFGSVVCSELLEHVPSFERAVGEIARVLEPGGTTVVTTPNRLSLYGAARWWWERKRPWPHPHDVWKSRGELEGVLARTGLLLTAARGACYLPAVFGVAMPRRVQVVLTSLVSPFEGLLSRLLPGFGYILAVSARKPGGGPA